MRKCRRKSCRQPLPTKKLSDKWQAAGYCNIDCMAGHGIDQAKALRERQQAKQAREARAARAAERKAHREAKRAFRDNDLSHQKELTKKECNRMIRLLDAGGNCPTCGAPLVDGQYDAGHVRTVAACPELRFDPRNIFGQCRSCNGSGTIRKRVRKTQEAVSELYKQWVLNTKGQRYYDWLFGPHEPKHYTCEDLKTMRAEFAAECRRLEAGLGPSKDWRAL